MDKVRLLELIESRDIDKVKLRCWVGQLPNRVSKPTKNKVGDVFMHPIFKHPYILLEKSNSGWICGIITHNGDFEEVLGKCCSRFFSDGYFTKVIFTVSDNPVGSFQGVYDNNRHLKSVCLKLKEIFKNEDFN